MTFDEKLKAKRDREAFLLKHGKQLAEFKRQQEEQNKFTIIKKDNKEK